MPGSGEESITSRPRMRRLFAVADTQPCVREPRRQWRHRKQRLRRRGRCQLRFQQRLDLDRPHRQRPVRQRGGRRRRRSVGIRWRSGTEQRRRKKRADALARTELRHGQHGWGRGPRSERLRRWDRLQLRRNGRHADAHGRRQHDRRQQRWGRGHRANGFGGGIRVRRRVLRRSPTSPSPATTPAEVEAARSAAA